MIVPVDRLLFAGLLVLWCGTAAAGTLEDMELRSNVEGSIRGAAQTANLHLKIQVENGVAIPEGVVRDLNQADEVADLAAKVRGITGVDRSRLRLEFAGPGDLELASLISRTLSEFPRYASSSVKVVVEQGVVTLSGSIENAAWRRELRKLCGGIEGVAEVADRLEAPATPDEKIQKALDAVFGLRVLPRFPGNVRAEVVDGVVTLDGRVPRLYDKQVAEYNARGINGVQRVDNNLELRSGTAIRVVNP
jgi:osmotically-inducible protein OsmY